jgi:hypothetical protein
MIETLEGRDVPSTLTVMNNLDSGPGSLRGEIAAASTGDTINFATSLNGQTITLTSGGLDIAKSLTIQGPGAGQLTISGGGNGGTPRVFEIDGASTNVTLNGLTITGGGWVSEGGGIYNGPGSTLAVSGCTVSGNAAVEGGGIANNGGTLTVSGCTVSGNSANYGGGIASFGGTVTVSGGSVSGNTVIEDGGGIANGDGYQVAGTMTIVSCTISGNSATYLGMSGINGGGVYNYNGVVTLTGCTLSDNSADWVGGAVYTYGTVTVTVTGKKPHTVTTTVVTGTTLSGCTVSGNSAGEYVGGYYNAGSSAQTLTLTNNVFSDNSDTVWLDPSDLYVYYGRYTDGGGNTFIYP